MSRWFWPVLQGAFEAAWAIGAGALTAHVVTNEGGPKWAASGLAIVAVLIVLCTRTRKA